MSRLEMQSLESMSPDQRVAYQAALDGPRQKVPTPMIAWLRNGEFALHAQHMGATMRFNTTLSPRRTELAILICARHWTSHVEWKAHKRLALEAGLPIDTIDALAAHRMPVFDDQVEKTIYIVSRELLSSKKLSDATYEAGKQALGEKGMVELVGILGYYCLVSLTLNAFELGLPDAFCPEIESPSVQSVKG